MSKLPKAPLVEVIFEIRWTVTGDKELQEVQYLQGDLYPLLKNQYPFRETVQSLPVEFFINAPSHRFRTAPNDYPLVQVGPGIVTINTIDAKYFWNEFENWALDVVAKLLTIYKFQPHQSIKLVLQYIDFLKFDFEKDDVLKFLEEYLNITIKQGFYKGNNEARNIILGLNFKTEIGFLNVNIGRGKDVKGFDGIAVHTNLAIDNVQPDPAIIKSWLNKAHELCSDSFKEMTRGKLYESFK